MKTAVARVSQLWLRGRERSEKASITATALDDNLTHRVRCRRSRSPTTTQPITGVMVSRRCLADTG